MQMIKLPNTDLTVSRLCFGCWGLTGDFHWGERDVQQSAEAIEAAIECGVNFFDTAAAYSNGDSEQLLGRILANRRGQVIVASKVRADMMTAEQIQTACEDSLKRLRTDYLDLYLTHWTSPTTPPEESWAAMLKLREQGKVRHVGACNLGRDDLSAICSLEAPACNQLPYNLLWRMIEDDILPECRSRDIGVLAYSPLMHGMLADKYQSASDVPDGMSRSRHFHTDRPLARHGEAGCEQQTFDTIAAIRDVAQSLGRHMADVALAWCAQRPGVCCVIAGASSPAQLERNAVSLDTPLPPEVVQQLEQATEALKQTLGPNPDMWEGESSSRFR
jgi:aryl-alcohol dehydrogenase-like predicted oxidoreductase